MYLPGGPKVTALKRRHFISVIRNCLLTTEIIMAEVTSITGITEQTMMETTDDSTTIKSRKTFYWLATGLASLGLMATGASDILHAPAVIKGLAELGYPAYFASIIGVWQLLGSAAILVPGIPRLTEWAYAGFFFTLTGASTSHAIAGDPLWKILFPLALLGVLAISWMLRPARLAVVAIEQPKVAPAMKTRAY